MTKEEFITGYCERSKLSRATFDRRLVVLPCQCAEPNCQGWAVVENEPGALERHKELYGNGEPVMKLVKVEHLQLGERKGYTFLMAEIEVTKEKLQQDVATAMDNYYKAKDRLSALGPKPRTLTLSDFPGSTSVHDAFAAIKKSKEDLYLWKEREIVTTKPFSYFMEVLGYISLGEAEAMKAIANWGIHPQGRYLNCGITTVETAENIPKEA